MLVVMVAVRMRRSLVSAFKELPRPAKKQVTDEERHGRGRVWGCKQGLTELIGRVGVVHRVRLRTCEFESR